MSRLPVQELAARVAARLGVQQKEGARFIADFFAIVREGLETDKQVKVKGLGTFKVTSVKARESVNVNTGEHLVIDGHNKISFTPDASMRDLVNKPFGEFQTVVLSDDVDMKLMESTTLLNPPAVPVPNPDELEQPEDNPTSDEPSTEKTEQQTEEPVAEEPKAEEHEQQAEEPQTEEHEQQTEEPAAEEPQTEEPEQQAEEHAAEEVQSAKETVSEEPKDEEQEQQAKESVSEQPKAEEHEQQAEEPATEEKTATEQQKEEPAKPSFYETPGEETEEDEPKHHWLRTAALWIGLLVLATIGAGFLCHYLNLCSAFRHDKLTTEVAQKQAVKPQPKKPIATGKQTFQLKPMSEYMKDPRIKYGAYDIVGIERTVTLREGETMQTVCNSTLGKLMICYFEAVNPENPSKPGDKVRIPKVKVRK